MYGRTAALKGVSLRLEAGQTLALLGPNGSGKTTLLRILAGATAPTAGSGSIFGLDIIANRIELRGHVGMLSGDSYLYEDLTARENLQFIVTMAGRKPDLAEMQAILKEVSLERHADKRVRTFSSGMRRRLSLARLLLIDPRMWLLDEPYNSLDEAGADLVDAIVRRVTNAGGAAILATHDAERALALADIAARLDRGVMVSFGPAAGPRLRHVEHVG
jgi:heme ABC exporter ATP-binding subunit CcmA